MCASISNEVKSSEWRRRGVSLRAVLCDARLPPSLHSPYSASLASAHITQLMLIFFTGALCARVVPLLTTDDATEFRRLLQRSWSFLLFFPSINFCSSWSFAPDDGVCVSWRDSDGMYRKILITLYNRETCIRCIS